jgi:hypothetical protein
MSGEVADCAGINQWGVVNERDMDGRSEPSWPEPSVPSRKAAIEALTGGKCRQGMELRNNRDRSADVVQQGGLHAV